MRQSVVITQYLIAARCVGLSMLLCTAAARWWGYRRPTTKGTSELRNYSFAQQQNMDKNEMDTSDMDSNVMEIKSPRRILAVGAPGSGVLSVLKGIHCIASFVIRR
jgi:hypothetical protein